MEVPIEINGPLETPNIACHLYGEAEIVIQLFSTILL